MRVPFNTQLIAVAATLALGACNALEIEAPGSEPGAGPETGPGAGTPPVAPSYSRHWYVSPQGSDTASGDQQHPFRTIQKGVEAVGPGEIVHVAAGTYAEAVMIGTNARSGTASARITLKGDAGAKLIPAGATPLHVKRPYWIVDAFEIDVQGKPEFAVELSGDTTGTELSNSVIHDGSAGAGVNVHTGARGVVIQNNLIHGFDRGDTDSHGIVVQTTTRDTTIRNNEIHGNSGDSVQCLGPDGYNTRAPADGLVIESNDLHSNRENAIDIKTCHNVTIRGNAVHHFRPTSSAKGEAIVIHLSARNVTVEDNDIYDAGRGISVGGVRMGPQPTNISIKRNRVRDLLTEGGMDGVGIRIEGSTDVRVLHNTIVRTQGPGLMLGKGTGGATTRLLLKNNIVQSPVAVAVGPYRSDWTVDANLYAPGASFKDGTSLIAFGAWRALGFDAGSRQEDAGVTESFSPGPPAIDRGQDVGLKYCGSAPDIGAVETGC